MCIYNIYILLYIYIHSILNIKLITSKHIGIFVSQEACLSIS